MDRRALLTRAAALCSAGAAAIHFGVTQQHFEQWWAAGAFFLVCAGWQAIWAVLVWNRPGMALLVAGAGTNAAVAALWAVTRTAGLPFGPDRFTPEPVGVADAASTVLEVAVVVLAGVLLVLQPSTASADTVPLRHGRATAAVTAVVAALVLLTSGVALAAPHEHGTAAADEHEDGSEGKAHKEPNLPDVSKATEEDTAKAEQLLADSIAETKDYRDTEKAQDAGYAVDMALQRWGRKHQNAGDAAPIRALHVGKPETRKDGKMVDPTAPETLIYRRAEGSDEFILMGVMYVVTKADGEPPEVAGPYTRWHTHKKGGAEMMHVWFVQDSELRQAYARRPPVKAIEEYQRTLP